MLQHSQNVNTDRPAILDCTIRDGGYTNNWNFSDEQVMELYDILNQHYIDYMEIGYFNTGNKYAGSQCGKWRNLTNVDIRTIIPIIKRTQLAVMVDYSDCDPDNIPNRDEGIISLIRVAFHKHSLPGAMNLCRILKAKGYIVSANAMAISNYSTTDLHNLNIAAESAGVDYLYIADSFGCIMPAELKQILFNVNSDKYCVGIHLHNNLNNALINVNECSGLVDMIDATIGGLGRGVGNLQMIPLLKLIQPKSVLLPNIFKFEYSLVQNTSLLYMISAIFECHPNYIVKMIEMDITDISTVWRVLSDLHACGSRHRSTFSFDLLNNLLR